MQVPERGCPQPQRVADRKTVQILRDVHWHSGVLRLRTAAVRWRLAQFAA